MAKREKTVILPRDPRVIRALIESSNGEYASVVYTKKDGSLRKQTFQRGNDARYVVNTERGMKASATFHENNPDMVRLRDVNVIRKLIASGTPKDEAEKKGWRTVTLTKLSAAKINRVNYRFY